jgi:hypothetical protein
LFEERRRVNRAYTKRPSRWRALKLLRHVVLELVDGNFPFGRNPVGARTFVVPDVLGRFAVDLASMTRPIDAVQAGTACPAVELISFVYGN